MARIVITKAGNEITSVYVSPEVVGDLSIDTIDYDHTLLPNDIIIENMIDDNKLTKIA